MNPRRQSLRWLVAAMAACLVGVIAAWPVETRSGVDYEWSSRRILLFEKVVDFVSRDLQTRRLVDDILVEISGEQEQVVAIFDWVGSHVRPVPEGFPIVDDHVLHIIIRGYGARDQRTEAFSLLASYAGMRSAAAVLKSPTGNAEIIVALVEIGERVYVFDVVNEIIFLDRSGTLVDVEQLMANPELVSSAAPERRIRDVPYEGFYESVAQARPNFSRMEMQKPWGRLRSEVSKLLGGVVGR